MLRYTTAEAVHLSTFVDLRVSIGVHLLQDLGDNYDMTPLFIASDQQFTDMVNELLSLGADPNYVSFLTGSYTC